jgi:hypothetical protein
MSYEYIGQPQLFLKILQQVDYLSLDGNVQSGDRLVADNKLRLERQSPCDTDTLPATAVELVG